MPAILSAPLHRRGSRHCLIHTVWQAEPDARPVRFGVRNAGFVQRVDTRVRAEGLTASGVADVFTPLFGSF